MNNLDFHRSSFVRMSACLAESAGKCSEDKWTTDHVCAANKDMNSYIYETNTFRITLDQGSMRMTITRLENNNPVVSIDEHGKWYRFHGEYRHIYDDVLREFNKLVEKGS